MLRFRTCCFVIPLRFGCFIIGYTHMVYHIIQTITLIIKLTSAVQLSKIDVEFKDDANKLIVLNAIMLFLLLVFLAFTVLLLIGLYKERRGYVKAFLIYALTFLIVYMILFFVTLGLGYIGILNTILGVLEMVIRAYFLLVIRSQYITMGSSGINGAHCTYVNNK